MQFPLNTDKKIQSILASVPEQIAGRYFNLENQSHAAVSAARGKADRLRALHEQHAEIVGRRERTVTEIVRFNAGQVLVSEDKDGKQNKKLNPLLQEIDDELSLIDRKIAEAEKLWVPKSSFATAKDFLHRLPAGVTLEATPLPKVKLPPGQTYADLYDTALEAMDADRKAGHALWDTAPDQATVFDRIDRMIARHANPIKLGGLARAFFSGSTTSVRHADIPNPEPLVPTVLLGRGIENIHGFDGFGALCSYIPDQIRQSLRDQFVRDFNDVDTITPTEKTKGVKSLTKTIWQHYIKIEEIYLAATAAGFQLERLRTVPAEVLLGCKPVGVE